MSESELGVAKSEEKVDVWHEVPLQNPSPPPRPMIPVSLYALISALVSEQLILSGNVGRCSLPLAVLGCLCLLALYCRVRAIEFPASLLPIGIAVLCACGSSWALLASEAHLAQELSSTSISQWEFITTSTCSEGSYSYTCRAYVVSEADTYGGTTGEVWLSLPEPVARGSKVGGVGHFSVNDDSEWGVSNQCRGICGTVRLVSISSSEPASGMIAAIGRLQEQLLEQIEPSSSATRALLAGLVCGSTQAADDFGLVDACSICGVAHLVAVSGGHITLISSLMERLLKRTRLKRTARLVLLALLSGAYVVLSGCAPSAIRAWFMSIAASCASLAGRRTHPLSSTCVVASIMCLVDPGVSGELGFTLSVASIVGISAFGDYSYYACETLVCPRARMLTQTLATYTRPNKYSLVEPLLASISTTLVAQCATLPIVVPTFSRISIISLVANLLLAPLLNWGLVIGLVAVSLSWLPLVGYVLLVCADFCLWPSVVVVNVLKRVPFASVVVHLDALPCWVVVGTGAVILLMWWPTLSQRVLVWCLMVPLCLCFFLYVRWRYFAPARIVVLDVGQGDAILVQEGARALLIDTGPDDAIAEALSRQHVFHLDAVVITHLHDDHYGGLSELVGMVGVDTIYLGAGVSDNEPEDLVSAIEDLTQSQAEELAYHDIMVMGSFQLQVISPVTTTSGQENEDSLVLSLNYQSGSVSLTGLLTGDAESEVLETILERGEIGTIDVLKVGHHGSQASITQEQAATLSPQVSIASAGEANSYGHPTDVCVQILEDAGSLFVCTIEAGDVTVYPSRAGIYLHCQKSG